MHAFDDKGGFSKTEWQMYWDELLRVLKPGGKAFIGPFDNLRGHEAGIMLDILRNMRNEGLIADFVVEGEEEIENDSQRYRGPDYVKLVKPQLAQPQDLAKAA